jgi:hypothetical protein
MSRHQLVASALGSGQAAMPPVSELSPPQAKAVHSLRARAALRGVVVHTLADGRFIAGQGSWLRELEGIDGLQRFVERIEGVAR